MLTNQLKDNPYSVVLLDEVEKASPSDAERVSAGVRRRLDHRRARQARLPERRDRDHDVEHRLGALPQADAARWASTRSRSASNRCRERSTRELERRFSPEFRNRIDEVVLFRAADARTKCGRSRSSRSRRSSATLARSGRDAESHARSARTARDRRLQPRLRRTIPEAGDRRQDQAADQPALDRGQRNLRPTSATGRSTSRSTRASGYSELAATA